MDSVLVTGGAGFIGGNYIRWVLNQRNVRVVNLDCLTYAGSLKGFESLANSSRHVFVRGEIGDRTLVRQLLAQYQCTAVLNFAAETHVDRSIGDPGSFVRTNVLGTFELLEAALGHWESLAGELRDRFRFLHVSTDEVYGTLPAEGLFSETTPYAPNSPYSASKAASDHFVRAYHHTYGLPVLTTNCSNNYGPFQFPEKLIPLTILNILDGRPIPVYGTGSNVRDWLYVDDHCRALQAVLESGRVGDVYNIGGNCERTNLQVVKTICQEIDELRPEQPYGPSQELIQFVTDRPGHDFRYAIDSSKIRNELGWQPAVTFEEGINLTIQWYQRSRERDHKNGSIVYERHRLGIKNRDHNSAHTTAAEAM